MATLLSLLTRTCPTFQDLFLGKSFLFVFFQIKVGWPQCEFHSEVNYFSTYLVVFREVYRSQMNILKQYEFSLLRDNEDESLFFLRLIQKYAK